MSPKPSTVFVARNGERVASAMNLTTEQLDQRVADYAANRCAICLAAGLQVPTEPDTIKLIWNGAQLVCEACDRSDMTPRGAQESGA